MMAAKKNKSNLQRKLKNIFYHYENGSNGGKYNLSQKVVTGSNTWDDWHEVSKA